jgi:6-phosphogluconate dehydrogenase
MKIGYIGLGKMGKGMVLNLLEKGIEIVAWNRSPEPREEVKLAGAETVENAEDVVSVLRQGDENIIVWLMLPAGETTDEFIDKILPLLKPGDLLIDGANSLFKDTLRRAEKIKPTGVHFCDIGVSGGPKGARTGACLMIGGEKEDFERIKELVVAASAPDSYKHLGGIGAGHLAKMVHNAIEYGMMESLGEGLAILKQSDYAYNFVELLDLYNHGSVIESRLVGWAKNAFIEDSELENTSSIIGSGGGGKERIKGEGDWTLELAKELGVDAPSIEASVQVRAQSPEVEENSPNGFRNKVVSALRGQFGGHSVKK